MIYFYCIPEDELDRFLFFFFFGHTFMGVFYFGGGGVDFLE